MEIDNAVCLGAKAVFIVSNNAAWNIERYDQAENYGGRVVGTTLKHSDYAGMAGMEKNAAPDYSLTLNRDAQRRFVDPDRASQPRRPLETHR
jgi:hypothetical protein